MSTDRERQLLSQVAHLQELLAEKSMQADELTSQLIASTSQSESYWRAAEGFRIQLLMGGAGRETGVEFHSRLAEMEENIAVLRSKREQAEQVAVAEIRTQEEVEQETASLRDKVRRTVAHGNAQG